MRYISTRGRAPALDFEGVTLAGLASDGGLYVPDRWPQLAPAEIATFARLSYVELATRIMGEFVGDAIPEDDLANLVAGAYAGFDDPRITPLVELGDNEWMLELHHGPTLAFKDLALQVLGRLFDYFLGRRGERITIVGATSGDTGSAAIEACRDRGTVEIFMLHPKGRVSDVQRRQMTTVHAANVHNIAIEGTFDDCQALVKALFADRKFRAERKLAAVNSINWARIAVQIVYYFHAAAALGAPEKAASFSVPSGNFGDVFAGYAASRMGLAIRRLVVATNVNDILDRALRTGVYQIGEVCETISPSMDIQVSSNFERLLFELHDRNGTAIAGLMGDLATDGCFQIGSGPLEEARSLFASCRVDEDQTVREINRFYRKHGVPVDPHTAVGIVAGRAHRRDPGSGLERGDDCPLIFLSTAHPAKFPDAVQHACGATFAIPERLAAVMKGREKFSELPGDIEGLKAFIRENSVV
ncbi:MAG: threonine synthase [Sphingomonadales bacterium]